LSILSEMPIDCPICHGVLLNEFQSFTYDDAPLLVKKCFRLSHSFYCASTETEENKLSFISICLDTYKRINIAWNLLDQEMFVFNENKNTKTILPWVDPDFSDPKKLITKLHIYLKYI
jgi:hypothetical protein